MPRMLHRSGRTRENAGKPAALELSFACYERLPLLDCDEWRGRLAASTDTTLERYGIDLLAFAFLPDGVRLVISRPSKPVDYSRLLYFMKRRFSQDIKLKLRQKSRDLFKRLIIREGPGRYVFRFWQPGPGLVRELATPLELAATIEAVHAGPVERGLCHAPAEWKWSSWAHYHLPGVPSDGSLPRVRPVHVGVPHGVRET